MSANSERCLLITTHSAMTPEGRDLLGNPDTVAYFEQLVATRRAEVTIGESELRVDLFVGGEEPSLTLLQQDVREDHRTCLLFDHHEKILNSFSVSMPLAANPAAILSEEGQTPVKIGLPNGLLLRAHLNGRPSLAPNEARMFWHDVLWITSAEPEDEAFWARLARYGVPERLELTDPESGSLLVEIEIPEVRRGDPPPLPDVGEFRLNEAQLSHFSEPETIEEPEEDPHTEDENEPSGGALTTYLGNPGPAEHIGWLISPTFVDELKKLINQLSSTFGTFDKTDPVDQKLVIDWYKRAEKKLGAKKKNAFTVIREVLKSAIAMSVIKKELEKGKIPPELASDWKYWMEIIIKDPKVPPGNRWCTLLGQILSQIKKEKPEFGEKPLTQKEQYEYRNKMLLDMVEKVLTGRYGTYKIGPLDPIPWSCWAFDFKSSGLRLKLTPGSKLFKDLKVTTKGLRLDLGFEWAQVELKFEVTPSGSKENVLLCVASLGALNIIESDSGSGKVTIKDLLLSFELTPKVHAGKQIGLDIGLGKASHAKLQHEFQGTNFLTPGKMEVVSLGLSIANKGEEDLLKKVGKQVTEKLQDFLVLFPEAFSFSDALTPTMDQGVIAGTPGKALLMGARLKLPKGTVPAPKEASGPPACAGDYAITLATEYLNAVLLWRLNEFQKSAKTPVFNWKKYLNQEDLPPVQLPAGYAPAVKPKDKPAKFPPDFEFNEAKWTITNPYLELGKLSGSPGQSDALGSIRFTVCYRVVRIHAAWRGVVSPPLVAPEWWWLGLGGPLGPDDYWLLEDWLTERFGLYRTAEGKVMSEPPAFLELPPQSASNPGPAAHAVEEVGGVVVEWSTFAVATDEHLSVDVDVTLQAHIALASSLSPSFLPELDLCYSNPEVKVTKLSCSEALSDLKGQKDLFKQLVTNHFTPFFKKHSFQKNFTHLYLPVYLISGESYDAWPKTEKVLNPLDFKFNINSMLDEADSTKLWIERDGQKLRINFRFLDGLI